MTNIGRTLFSLAMAASLLAGTTGAYAGSTVKQSVTPGDSHHHGCPNFNCAPPPPGATQPTCKGPHKGPNGVMIQCD